VFKNKVGSDSQILIQPTSKKATVSKKSGVGSLQKVVANDEMRPNLQSVYFEEGNMIATDANQLVIIKQKESNDEILNQFKEAVVKRLGKLVGATQAKKEAEKYLLENKIGKDVSGKILDFKSGTVVDGKYPNYKAVIPYNTLYTGEVNIQELIDLANGTNNVFKNIDSKANAIVFDFKDGENTITIGFNPEILLNNLQALQSNGSTKVELGVSAPNRALTIKTDNGNFGLVMPLMISEDSINRTQPIPIDVFLSETEAKKEIDRLKKSKTDGFYARELAQAKKDKDEDDIKRYSEKVKEEEAENKARISDIEKRIKEASKTKPESVSIADKIRSLKVKGKTFESTLGIPVAIYNGALEAAATAWDVSESISDAIKAAVDHIRKSDWYKSLSDKERSMAEAEISSEINDINDSEEDLIPISENDVKLFEEFDAINKSRSISERAAKRKEFEAKHGEMAAKIKDITTNFDTYIKQLKDEGVIKNVDCE